MFDDLMDREAEVRARARQVGQASEERLEADFAAVQGTPQPAAPPWSAEMPVDPAMLRMTPPGLGEPDPFQFRMTQIAQEIATTLSTWLPRLTTQAWHMARALEKLAEMEPPAKREPPAPE